jgi:hypothetical protein
LPRQNDKNLLSTGVTDKYERPISRHATVTAAEHGIISVRKFS